MATIIQLRGSDRSSTDNDQRMPTLMVGALLVALAMVLGAPLVGAAVGMIFCVGVALARLEQRVIQPGEFAAIATLHGAAVVMLAF